MSLQQSVRDKEGNMNYSLHLRLNFGILKMSIKIQFNIYSALVKYIFHRLVSLHARGKIN